MVKRETRSDDRDPTAAVAAVLDAARREAGGLGKSARRRLARLERRIGAALKAEAKRRRQLDEARVELADLVARVADLVQPTAAPDAVPTSASAPNASTAPKPAAPKAASARTSAAPKSAVRRPAAARRPAAPKSAPAQPTAESAARPAAPRRRSPRGTDGSAGGPGS